MTNVLKNSWIKVGLSTCGIAAGAGEVFTILNDEAKKKNINIPITQCGCVGMCSVEPLVEVCVEGLPTVMYGNVDRDTALKILDKHVIGKRLVNDHIINLS